MNPDFGDAIAAPFRDRQWFAKLLIGGVFSLTGWLIIPQFLFDGYLLRVIRGAAYPEQGLPEWDDWGEMLAEGALWFAINLIYSLIAVIPIGGTILAGVFFWVIPSNEGGPWVLAFVGTMLFVAAGACVLFFNFWMPAVRVHFAHTNDFGRAFAVGEIWCNLKRQIGPFALAWIFSIVVWMVGIVVWAISFITIIGPLVVWSYLYIVPARMFGQALAPAYPAEPGPGAFQDS